MTKWGRKGFAAGKSGKYADMYDAWSKAKGKPSREAKDSRWGGLNGKYVEAQEYFYEGFLEGSRQQNPARALPVGRFVTVKVKRLANGRVEVYNA